VRARTEPDLVPGDRGTTHRGVDGGVNLEALEQRVEPEASFVLLG
jgi:hypothetical protein